MQDWTKDAKQVELFWQRSQGVGVNRRDFLKILAAAGSTAALAACAPATGGQVTTDGAAAPAAAASGAPAAPVPDAEQVFRTASDVEPSSQDFNKDLYCGGNSGLFAGLTKFDKDRSYAVDRKNQKT